LEYEMAGRLSPAKQRALDELVAAAAALHGQPVGKKGHKAVAKVRKDGLVVWVEKTPDDEG
jgi:hypothetical protein